MRYNFELNIFEEIDVLPHKIALAGSDADYSWLELKHEVESFSKKILSLGLSENDTVIIYGHKEAFFIIALLSCYRSGLRYSPVDKIYPQERVQKIIDITGAKLLINCTGEPLPFELNTVLEIDNLGNCKPDVPFNYKGFSGFREDYVQYVMFTSGSSGEPKGVPILRSSVLSFVKWSVSEFGFSENDVFLNQAPFTFDVSLSDFLNAFALGGTLVLTSSNLASNYDAFIDRLIKYGCSVWTSTPSFVFIYLRHPRFSDRFLPRLKLFFFMGEELPARTCNALFRSFSDCHILNGYGPTEATIITTLIEITVEIASSGIIPIGYAMPGSLLFLDNIDQQTNEGELVISGPHVSIGYLNRSDLNETKFLQMNDGTRAFRSGDIVSIKNGIYYFHGRKDNQIKFHGFRIELDEISNVLCEQEGVSDAVTVALKRNNEVKKIISFIKSTVFDQGTNVRDHFYNSMKNRLPYYMIPSEIITLNEFPINVSHKVDKNRMIEIYLESNR